LKIPSVKQKLAAYLEVLRWLARDSLFRFPKESLVIIGGSFCGLAFQGFAIGQVLYYAKLLDQGGELHVLDFSFVPRESLALLVIVASGILISSAISSYLIFKVKDKGLTLSLLYERLLIRRAYDAWGRGCISDGRADCIRYPESVFSRIVNSDCKLCSRTFWKLLQLVEPFCVLIFSVCALFYLDWMTTLMLIPLTVVGGRFIVKINVESAKAYSDYEQLSSAASVEKRSAWRRFLGISGEREGVSRAVETFLHDGKSNDQIEAYRRYMLTSELNVCINSIILGAGFFCILFFIGIELMQTGVGWHRLTAYLLGLRFAVTSLKTVSSTLLAINRFFPQVKRLSNFLERGEEPDAPVEAEGDISLRRTRFENEARGYQGKRLAVIAPFDIERNAVGWITAHLSPVVPVDLQETDVSFLGNVFEATDGESLRQGLGLSEATTNAAVQDLFKKAGWWERYQDDYADLLTLSYDEPLSPAQWNKIHKRNLIALFLMDKILHSVPILVLDAMILNHLPAKGRDLLDLLSQEETMTIVVYGVQAKVFCFSWEDGAVLFDHEGQAEFLDVAWCQANAQELAGRVAASRAILLQQSVFNGVASASDAELEEVM